MRSKRNRGPDVSVVVLCMTFNAALVKDNDNYLEVSFKDM